MFIILLLLSALLIAMAVTEPSAEYGDIIMDKTMEGMKKAGVKPVMFPHWFHRIRFKCKACHEGIFVMEKGGNNITMNAIMAGKSCGVCHDGKIAWESLYCDRCHFVEK
jgi:c(7)-type cytochrome triheme protein